MATIHWQPWSYRGESWFFYFSFEHLSLSFQRWPCDRGSIDRRVKLSFVPALSTSCCGQEYSHPFRSKTAGSEWKKIKFCFPCRFPNPQVGPKSSSNSYVTFLGPKSSSTCFVTFQHVKVVIIRHQHQTAIWSIQ